MNFNIATDVFLNFKIIFQLSHGNKFTISLALCYRVIVKIVARLRIHIVIVFDCDSISCFCESFFYFHIDRLFICWESFSNCCDFI